MSSWCRRKKRRVPPIACLPDVTVRPQPTPDPIPVNQGRKTVVRCTVIVCCYNAESRVGPTLAALSEQQFPAPWELLVVDNNSTDRTAEVARASWARADVPMTVLSETRQGLIWARLCGLAAARGEWICFVDDDNHLAPDYLAIADDILERNERVALVGGEAIPSFEITPPAWLTPAYWKALACGPQASSEGLVKHPLYGAGICLRQTAWVDLKSSGWEPILQGRSGNVLLSGEDVELALVAICRGWQLYYSPRLRFRHLIPGGRLEWPYWLRLYDGFGRTDSILSVLGGVLDRRGSRAAQAVYVLFRTCYAIAHVPLVPVFWAAVRYLPEGSPTALRGSFRMGYASHGLLAVGKVWGSQWWRRFR